MENLEKTLFFQFVYKTVVTCFSIACFYGLKRFFDVAEIFLKCFQEPILVVSKPNQRLCNFCSCVFPLCSFNLKYASKYIGVKCVLCRICVDLQKTVFEDFEKKKELVYLSFESFSIFADVTVI